MKLHLIPFDPVILPPDLMLALRHPQYFFAAGGILLTLIAVWLLFVPRDLKSLRRATRRSEMETQSILSRLAHHGRHRLWQDQFRH